MDGFGTHKLLTVAVPTDATPAILASVQSQFDQINLMTYDLSGPWEGWVTWFNAPVYNEALTFPSVPGEPLPSIDGAVANFLAAGIATNKLGIGIPFYGYIWQGGVGTSTGGATQPYQSWTTAPSVNAFPTTT
jgi:chitinase